MKTIGLLGGMSWESTELYYRLINEETKRIRGGLHSAPLAMVSVDFQAIERLQQADDWASAGEILANAARKVEAAGAELLLICSNTMHRVADAVSAAVEIPLLHLADATASEIRASGLRTVGLLGTRFTMEQDFYTGKLEQHGLRVHVPPPADREIVHRVIFEELCLGTLNPASRDEFLRIIADLEQAGAQAVVEGCTEIGLLVKPDHTHVTLFDTTAIHARHAVSRALDEDVSQWR